LIYPKMNIESEKGLERFVVIFIICARLLIGQTPTTVKLTNSEDRSIPGTITLTTSANPSPLGQALALTVTIPGGSGKITFYDGTAVLGTAAIKSGQAVLTTSLLGAGTHALKAGYFSPPASATLSQVINASADASLLELVNYILPNQIGFLHNSIIMADFNGDGKPDIATGVSIGLDAFFSVQLGNGDGTFASPLLQSIPSGTAFDSALAGDLNEDGKVDLAIPYAGGVILYFGKGDGTFRVGYVESISQLGTISPMVAADFNGDGHIDLLVILATASIPGRLFLGVGNGTFRPALNVGTGASPIAMAVGDFNGDGNPDLAVAQPSQGTFFKPAPGYIDIVLGNGDGTFRTPVSYPIRASGDSPGTWFIVVSDFNRDGNADLAISGADTNTQVLLGKGDGTFNTVASYGIAGCCGALSISDLNGDGIPDLLLSSFTFLLGNGDGSFHAGLTYGTVDNDLGYSSVVIGDFNGDGLPDVALTLVRGGVNVFLGSSVAGANQLVLSPASVTANGEPFTNPPSQTVTLTYQTTTPGTYTFRNSSKRFYDWVTATPASGPMTLASSSGSLYTYTATVSLSFDVSGVHFGSLNTGDVSFTVNDAPAALSVAVGSHVTSKVTGVINAASGAQGILSVVSTGSYVALFGSVLAGSANPLALSLPLPATLNGTQVTLGGLSMPLLYAAGGQINAIVPQGLAANNSYPLVVSNANGTVLAPPVSLLVTELQPAIYTVDSSGSGSGIVANNSTGLLITTKNPAHVSDYLVIYCTGLGPLLGPNGEPEPADGAPAPTNLVFHTKAAISATIGGVSAPVLFAGLTPNLAGLYQVNVQVPPGVAAGTAVPVVISARDSQTSASGQSNSVLIAVQ